MEDSCHRHWCWYSGYSPFRYAEKYRKLYQPRSSHTIQIFCPKRLKTIEDHVYIHGDTIGGGSLGRAILRHIQKGYRVVMEESAAYSIRNDLDEVKSMGIEVGKKPETDHFEELEIREVNLPLFEKFLSNFRRRPPGRCHCDSGSGSWCFPQRSFGSSLSALRIWRGCFEKITGLRHSIF